ncbi:MAG: hypothetical protein MJ169_04625 [Treponema sp.]|nr:hypothetical protein [Treponema sp.]
MKILKNAKIIFISICLILQGVMYAQNSNTLNENNESANKGISIKPYFTIGTDFIANTMDKTKSAPSTFTFTAGAGAIIQFTQLISFEPKLNFYPMYYLWNDSMALPAEIEQRTAAVLNFLLDLPVGFNFKSGKNTFTPGAGIAMNIRFAFLAGNIKPGDYGTSGTAASDVEKINSYFWNNMNFLYPEIFIAWDYAVTDSIRVGAQANVYFPIGSLIESKGINGLIVNLSARVVF